MTLPQIKSTTGHKSDTVVQGYIDNSMVQKRISADALSVGKSKKRKFADENLPPQNSSPQIVYNISGNCNVNFNSGC